MKLRLLLLLSLLAGYTALYAQQRSATNNRPVKQRKNPVTLNKPAASNNTVKLKKCGFASMMAKAKAKGYNEELYEDNLRKLIKRRLAGNKTAFTGIVTIPVIFHSIYRTGQLVSANSPNLVATKYQAQVDQLNKDYANLSGSAYGVAADVKIRFCMAVVDTAGRTLAEPGIDRINGASRGWSNTNTMSDDALEAYFEETIKPASIWDPYSYFNVWTAAMASSGLLGYATFPSISTLPGLDNAETDQSAGVVIAWQSVGSVAVPGADANYGLGRTLVHESGHFFGLRHIWGDDNCGNDYCGDTPPQDQETTGCPATGTLNGCSPSVPKMFENFMDYTDDACTNTFTAEQALRCQTAMDNSPRRFSLIASTACQSRAANSIQFAASKPYTFSEAGNPGGCPNTKSYSFNLYVAGQASGNASVTFSVMGGTATQNIDYTISPATVTYTAGDNGVKTVTITVIDDQAAEGDETIELGLSISGTGVVAGIDKQTLSIIITDDDVADVQVNNLAAAKTVLSENFNASANIPAGWTTEVYDDGSGGYTTNKWVVSANGGSGTTGNAAHISRSTTTKTNQYNGNNLSDAYLFTPLLDASGLRDLNFSFKWRCLGEEGYDAGYVGYIPEGQSPTAANVIYFDSTFDNNSGAARTTSIQLPASLGNKKFYLAFNWFNDEAQSGNPPFTIDDVTVTGKYFTVASAAGADTVFTQYSGQTVAYYSKDGVSGNSALIATIANPSEDLGCVTVGVQNTGSGKSVLLTTGGGYFRTDKVISITPAAANSTASYQATLYFTAAELSPTWTAAEIPQLKILKIKDGVNLSSTVNAADLQVVTPVFSENTSGGGYYSYTGSFTGFSQFLLGFPSSALPVRYTGFEVKSQASSIVLHWATSEELNNKGFRIERSTDGIHFEQVYWVNGKGTTSSLSDYTFNDNFVQPNIIYYYRLKQVNFDNMEYASAIRQGRITKNGITVTVNPVPAKNELKVFISGTDKSAAIDLVNTQGQLIKSWRNVTPVNTIQSLDVSNISTGIYMLNVITAGEKIVKKVLIEK
ncbi:MAG: M43 family zinc metalloprotease [Ferruginibacter sp.]